MRRYKKSTKATIKVPMTRNYEAIYTPLSEINEVHRFTQKKNFHMDTPIFRIFLLFSKSFYTLTLASKMLCKHHTGDYLKRDFVLGLQEQ